MPSQAGSTSASPRKRSASSFLLRLVLILVILIALTECVLRFGVGLGNPVMVIADPACEYVLKPDQSITRFFARNYVNHVSMRSDPIPPAKDPHTARLFFLGDSVAYGTSRIDQDKLFTQLVHQELPGPLGAPVDLLNASTSAWALDNELSYLNSRGSFQSDLLLLVVNTGDLTQARATIAEVGDGLAIVKPHFALQEIYNRYLLPKLKKASQHIDAGDAPQEDPEMVKQNLARLDQIKQYAADHHMDFVVLFFPFRVNIDPANRYAKFAEEARTDLLQWSAVRNVPALDLTPVELHYPVKEFTLDGVHFSNEGNRIAADQIEKFLLDLHASHKILKQFP